MINKMFILIFTVVFMTLSGADSANDVLFPLSAGSLHLNGHLADRIDLVIKNRITVQDYPSLVVPFRTRPEATGSDWKCEFWGKCFRSLHEAYCYNQSPSLKAKMDSTVKDLLSTQTSDGCISTYSTSNQLYGWDVWGRKYILLGLLRYYYLTQSDTVLQAIIKEADYLLSQAGPSPKREITSTGEQAGLASCSILEPMVQLYNVTGYQRYLDFANYIAGTGGTSGNNLITGAIRGDQPSQLGNGKAYEMTSVFEGLVELYRVTGNPDYRQACLDYWQSVVDHEIVITGTGGRNAEGNEFWGDTYYDQATNEMSCELCITVTWMKYNYQLLRLTGDSRYADQIEKTIYNDLLGAVYPDGSWTSYFASLNNTRVPSYIQHLGLSCCVANGGMGMVLIPEMTVMSKASGPVINLYCGGTTIVPVSGNDVQITQITDYPKSDTIIINIKPAISADFSVSLRIPEWSDSAHTGLTVNGGADIAVTPGTYKEITRTWSSSGDQIVLKLDMRGRRVIDYSSEFNAVLRGPLVLARDVRSGGNLQEDVPILSDSAGYISLVPAVPPDGIWMAYQAPALNGTASVVDYSSAGNTFNSSSAYRTWMHYVKISVPNTWNRVNDNTVSATYSSGVSYASAAGYYANSAHFANTMGEYAQFAFKGTGVRWIGKLGKDHGTADVYLDGRLMGSVSTYSAVDNMMQVCYEKTGLADTNHTLKIVLTSNNYTDWDAFEYYYTGEGGMSALTSSVVSDGGLKIIGCDPNPFNPSVNIQVSGCRKSTELKILNVSGMVVADLTSVLNIGSYVNGVRQVTWNGAGHASGVYLVLLRHGNMEYKRKVLLIK